MRINREYIKGFGFGFNARAVTGAMMMMALVSGSALAQSTTENISPFKFHDLDSGANTNLAAGAPTVDPVSVEALEFAAKEGDEIAMWQLGRHYSVRAKGKGNHLRAFEMFSRLVRTQGAQTPYSNKAPFTAHALVSLGSYYRKGIPDTYVSRNSDLAWSMFMTAATSYGDPRAQYSLFQMCDGELTDRCSQVQAGRWLKRSAVNGEIIAQAQFGHRQFEGEKGVRRDKVAGLTWLTIARERAHVARHAQVFELHERAFSLASAEERQEARVRAEKWMQQKCGNVLTC